MQIAHEVCLDIAIGPETEIFGDGFVDFIVVVVKQGGYACFEVGV